ncbi:MAG: flagellar motor protein MotB [Thermodesulfobacteriota bacterium]
MVRIYALMSIALLVILTGCVSSSKYNLLKTELVETKEENSELARNVLLMEKEYADGIANRETQAETMEEVVDELQDEVDAETVKVNLHENTLHIEVVNRLLYESGSAAIKPEGREVLARIAPILKRAEGKTIKVVGHTDPLPPSARLRKRYPSNWDLSVARATSVIKVLQWGLGINPKRLVAAGVAEYRPLAVGEEEDVEAANRAVEIILVPSEE